MAFKNTMQAMPALSFASASLSGSYQLLTPTTGLANYVLAGYWVNNGSTDISISYDGTTLHDFVPKGTVRSITGQIFTTMPAPLGVLPASQRIWISGTAGTGNFYMVGYYAPIAVGD